MGFWTAHVGLQPTAWSKLDNEAIPTPNKQSKMLEPIVQPEKGPPNPITIPKKTHMSRFVRFGTSCTAHEAYDCLAKSLAVLSTVLDARVHGAGNP